MPPRARHLYAIDLVRFGCAMAVLAFHYAALFTVEPDTVLHAFAPAATLSSRWHDVTWFGWVGVDVFFVISGYVIATSSVGADTTAFVRRRVLRLAPTAWMCATITAAVLLIGSNFPALTTAERWIAAITFYPVPQPIDPSYWSLSVEACFYLVVALLLRGGVDVDRRIDRLGMVLAVAGTSYWMVTWLAGTGSTTMQRSFALNLTLLPHGLFFALGILLSVADRHGWTGRRRLAAAALMAAAATKQIGQAVASDAAMPLLPALLFSVMIAAIITARSAQPSLQRIAGVHHLRTVGLMTYPLYLLHQVVGAACLAGLWRMGVADGTAMLLTTAAMLLLAFAITVWAEPAMRLWLDAITRPRAPARDTRPSAFPPAG